MSEKILTLPKEEVGFIYPIDIDNSFKGTITVWENEKLIGFIWNNDDEWIFIKGITQVFWDEDLAYILNKYSNYTFKVNLF